MRLSELEPQFIRYEMVDGHELHHKVPTLAEAQGIQFLCPVCYRNNGGAVGTHMIKCWSRSRGCPEDAVPGPGRWKMEGTGIDDLTFNADPPVTQRSIRLTGGCGAHFNITNGEVENT